MLLRDQRQPAAKQMPKFTWPDVLKLFEHLISGVFGVMLLFIALGLMVGVMHLFVSLHELVLNDDIASHYVRVISEVLALFILVELSRSLVNYFSEHRLRMTFIVDAGIVFVLREIMIKLFEHDISPGEIYALSVLLLVLGCLRIGSILVFQREKAILEHAMKRTRRSQKPSSAKNPIRLISS